MSKVPQLEIIIAKYLAISDQKNIENIIYQYIFYYYYDYIIPYLIYYHNGCECCVHRKLLDNELYTIFMKYFEYNIFDNYAKIIQHRFDKTNLYNIVISLSKIKNTKLYIGLRKAIMITDRGYIDTSIEEYVQINQAEKCNEISLMNHMTIDFLMKILKPQINYIDYKIVCQIIRNKLYVFAIYAQKYKLINLYLPNYEKYK